MSPQDSATRTPLQRLGVLLGEAGVNAVADPALGYVDLLPPAPPDRRNIGQSLMQSRLLPVVYERWWRPFGGWVAGGMHRQATANEQATAARLLRIEPGDVVLDVACGPGNFTRRFASQAGPAGLSIGLDASPTMLARAVRDTEPDLIAYLRADARKLPLPDGSVDAVCCFAALNLMDRPEEALAEMARVLAPGGRVAILTSVERWRVPSVVQKAVAGFGGLRVFGRDEITGALSTHGITSITQEVRGVTQIVGGRKVGG